MFLRDQAVAKRLLAKFEILEPVKTKVGGLHVLGAKNSRELTHSEFYIEVRALVGIGGLVGDGAIVKGDVYWQHVLLCRLFVNRLATLPGLKFF